MQPLETIRRVMTWLYIHPANEDSSMLRKSIYATIAVVYILISLAFFFASTAFFWKWALIDFKVALNVFWQIMMSVLLLYGLVVMLISRSKVKQTFETLSDIYYTSKNHLFFKFVNSFTFFDKQLFYFDFIY